MTIPKHGSMLLYVHRNRKAHYDGEGAQDGHLDFHTAPELCLNREVELGFQSKLDNPLVQVSTIGCPDSS